MNLVGRKGTIYLLSSTPFGCGGEGKVYEVINRSNCCAKIYNLEARKSTTEAKLQVMINKLPNASVLSQIAWPLDLLYTPVGEFVGFTMPRINASDELMEIYEYPPQKYIDLTYKQKLKIAQNICKVIDGLHEAGYIYGDFNPQNIGIDAKTLQAGFWDTDTCHVYDDRRGITYRSEVCLDGYVAPELLRKMKAINPLTGKIYSYRDAPWETFTVETDNFSLAIHMFKLMMNGFSPFGGVIANQPINSTTAPGPGNIAVERNAYCFNPGYTHMSRAVPDKDVLPPEIIRLFERAFISGVSNPSSRPSAKEWSEAIERFSNELVECKNNQSHQYLKGLKNCPWCEAAKRFEEGIKPVTHRYQTVINSTTVVIPAVPPSPRVSNSAIQTSQTLGKRAKSKIPIKAKLMTLLMCIITIIVFCIYDAIKWESLMTPSGYKTHTNEVHLASSHWPNTYSSDLVSFTGTLKPNETRDYLITTESYLSVDFITHTSGAPVDIMIIREDGRYKSFSSNTRDFFSFSDGYNVELNEKGTYVLRVSSSFQVDYVIELEGYFSLKEGN